MKYLYDHPEGLDIPTPHPQCAHVKDCKQFHQVVAKAGDVFLLHGLLPHAAGPNYLHYARVISNPHVSLAGPHQLYREDGNYVSAAMGVLDRFVSPLSPPVSSLPPTPRPSSNLSRHDAPQPEPRSPQSLLEQVILNGLSRPSGIPEWSPTRPRAAWYPRNAGFKRAYADLELARLIAHYKAQGLSEADVDSIYQKQGTKEWREYEERNGFSLEVNPNGNLMEQHDIGSFTR